MTIAMVVALTLLAAFVAGACGGQPQDPTPTATTSAQSTSVPASPTSVPPSPTPTQGTEAPEAPGLMAAGAGLALPPGFGANVFFVGLTSPTSMTFSPDGTLFVSQEDGAIVAIIDFDGDGRADGASGYARGFTAPLGLVFHEGALYVSSRGSVTIIRDDDGDGQGDVIERIISGLPNGPHQNNGLAFGPDGMLYLTLGSTCNACIEEDPRSATIMRFNPDGSGGEVFARGLRNVYDIAFHPLDGTLFGADNGRDEEALGVPEELNLLVEGADYGWPDCWGRGGGTNCQGTTAPVVELEPRSSADGLAFYTGGQFPAEYKNDLFIAMWGSHSREAGRKIVRVRLQGDGDSYTAQVSDFALGFDRPLDLVVAPDGALLVGDYGSGTIYRIYWEGYGEDG